MSWNNNGNLMTGTYVEMRIGTGAWTRLAPSAGATATTYTATGLTTSTTYQFRVQAFNADGVSGYSNIITATTLSGGIANFVATPSVTSSNPPTFALSWTNPLAAQTGYTIQLSRDSAFATIVKTVTVTPGTATSTTVSGLLTNQLYYIRITAINGAGTPPYATTSATTSGQFPGTPAALLVGTRTATSIAMSWNNNGNLMTGTYVEMKIGAGPWTRLAPPAGATATTYTVNGLTTLTTYQFRVQAFNADGVSGYSNTLTATTL
jgi:hypothetical protein